MPYISILYKFSLIYEFCKKLAIMIKVQRKFILLILAGGTHKKQRIQKHDFNKIYIVQKFISRRILKL